MEDNFINFNSQYRSTKVKFLDKISVLIKENIYALIILLLIIICSLNFLYNIYISYNKNETQMNNIIAIPKINSETKIKEIHHDIESDFDFTNLDEVNKTVNTNNDEIRASVYLSGEIKKPGVYSLSKYPNLDSLVKVAGGFTTEAFIEPLNLAYIPVPGQRIHIAGIDEWSKVLDDIAVQKFPWWWDSSLFSLNNSNEQDMKADHYHITNNLININTATVIELSKIPYIGDKLAEQIYQYRQAKGVFKKKEDLMKIKGIKKGKLQKISPFIIID